MTQISSAVNWFVLCSVHDTHHIFRFYLFSNALTSAFCNVFVQSPRFTSAYVAVGNIFVLINLIFVFVICCLSQFLHVSIGYTLGTVSIYVSHYCTICDAHA